MTGTGTLLWSGWKMLCSSHIKRSRNHKENLSSGKFSATSNHRVPYPYPRIRIRICPYPGPSCLHLHPSTLRGRQRISPFSSFSISKNSLCLWRLLRFVVRLLPTFNYLESFHILNLLACCLCPDFFVASICFSLQKFLCFPWSCCSWVQVAPFNSEDCGRDSESWRRGLYSEALLFFVGEGNN